MIPRYSRPEMVAIWEPANKFRIWFEIEAHACDAQSRLGVIPAAAAKTVWEKGDKPYTPERIARIDEIELETKHDVIAFLTELAEHIGEPSRFVHQGMTSSDVLDTCLSVQLSQAADLLLADLDKLLAALKRRAFEAKDMPCIGRSHGIHAEPVTYGLKFARFYAEFARHRDRLLRARMDIATCAISGAVGTFANIDPAVEEYVADKLGLTPEPVSTQVIPRDRHAAFFATLGVIASSIENVAIEIRHAQRTEVREAQEYFAPGQKGSSAMPHKRNPILSENLTGLARTVRMAVVPALENVALWHERDISHSSVERMIGPDATVTLDFALGRLTGLIDKLVLYPQNMRDQLNNFGGIHDAQRVLLYLTQNGVSREDAYKIVQRNAMRVWKSFGIDPDNTDAPAPLDETEKEAAGHENRLFFFLSKDQDLAKALRVEDLKALLEEDSISYHTKRVDTIFKRVFGA
ncbi:adenylosuccinate lyase [Varunaivibrio sulfuroxidans]|uniref:Adenylosuccinate lyase n=1 Tax=Varunaivibrio sulfuroxidans TaxID=1773489 RepID=A0A4R3JG04_9PROT|nr:adenylosuccinate lyase [Varunaivibrio sulfuroxidans]TCS65079.1 adenylosuccinate lyase [Varunaivibrio sulfuroxidans]WES29634.1 adenylosuccinate lyase [Varunaivibrio sulfuroxidans]